MTPIFPLCERLVEKATEPAYVQLHEAAVQAGKMTYIDPQSGYQVFTELYHLNRGSCCQSACRHCPYGFGKA